MSPVYDRYSALPSSGPPITGVASGGACLVQSGLRRSVPRLARVLRQRRGCGSAGSRGRPDSKGKEQVGEFVSPSDDSENQESEGDQLMRLLASSSRRPRSAASKPRAHSVAAAPSLRARGPSQPKAATVVSVPVPGEGPFRPTSVNPIPRFEPERSMSLGKVPPHQALQARARSRGPLRVPGYPKRPS